LNSGFKARPRRRHDRRYRRDTEPFAARTAKTAASQVNQDFVILDEALEALARFDERKNRVIELRFAA
jgi:hypothetical protein